MPFELQMQQNNEKKNLISNFKTMLFGLKCFGKKT
jgi:hypothetical protein